MDDLTDNKTSKERNTEYVKKDSKIVRNETFCQTLSLIKLAFFIQYWYQKIYCCLPILPQRTYFYVDFTL